MRSISENIQIKVYTILDNDDILEEDKIELIEDLILQEYSGSDLSSNDKERLILDILWAHREHKQNIDKEKLNSNNNNGNFRSRPSSSNVVRLETVPANWAKTPYVVPPSDPSLIIKRDHWYFSNSNTNAKGVDEKENDRLLEQYFDLYDDFTNVDSGGLNGDDMSPFDMLRHILGSENSDLEIMHALEKNEYDIASTISNLTKINHGSSSYLDENQVGQKDNQNENTDDITLKITEKVLDDNERVLCKYFVQFGECFRADCMYSHDLSARICRFWLRGGCLSGDSCAFLHDIPSEIINKINLEQDLSAKRSPSIPKANLHDESDFPSLGNSVSQNTVKGIKSKKAKSVTTTVWGTPTNLKAEKKAVPSFSYNPAKAPVFIPGSFDFLQSVAEPEPKLNAGKKLITTPNIIRPLNRSTIEIGVPDDVPWLTSGKGFNKEYISHRSDAIRCGELRNKYLQLAADSWHKNNAEAAKKLSVRGKKFHDMMMQECRLASDMLRDQWRDPDDCVYSIYIDLYGLDRKGLVGHLEETLLEVEDLYQFSKRPAYIICGSENSNQIDKNGDDKMTKLVKKWLNEWSYNWKSFKVGDPKFGNIIGVDPWSHL